MHLLLARPSLGRGIDNSMGSEDPDGMSNNISHFEPATCIGDACRQPGCASAEPRDTREDRKKKSTGLGEVKIE